MPEEERRREEGRELGMVKRKLRERAATTDAAELDISLGIFQPQSIGNSSHFYGKKCYLLKLPIVTYTFKPRWSRVTTQSNKNKA